MARARNLKPSFFTDDELAEIAPLGRLLFAGLWCIADREGRLEDRPKRIQTECLPYDKCNVDTLLTHLDAARFIIRYAADGKRYIQIRNFLKHQDPHYKEKASDIPPPEGWNGGGGTPGAVPNDVREKVFERDGRKCKRCGATEHLSIDHIVPRSAGGSHDEDNLQTLCRRCNSSKNNSQSSANHHPTDDRSSPDDKAIKGRSSANIAALIPDSGFPLPDSGFRIADSPSPPPDPGLPQPADVTPARRPLLPNGGTARSRPVEKVGSSKANGHVNGAQSAAEIAIHALGEKLGLKPGKNEVCAEYEMRVTAAGKAAGIAP